MMPLNTNKPWLVIHPRSEDLKKEMLEIASFAIPNRFANEEWAQNLTFIAPRPQSRSTLAVPTIKDQHPLPCRTLDYWEQEEDDDYEELMLRLEDHGEEEIDEDGNLVSTGMKVAGEIQEALERFEAKQEESIKGNKDHEEQAERSRHRHQRGNTDSESDKKKGGSTGPVSVDGSQYGKSLLYLGKPSNMLFISSASTSGFLEVPGLKSTRQNQTAEPKLSIDQLSLDDENSTIKAYEDSEPDSDDSSSCYTSSVSTQKGKPCPCIPMPTFDDGHRQELKLLSTPDLTKCNHFLAVSFYADASHKLGTDDSWTVLPTIGVESKVTILESTMKRVIAYAKAIDIGLIFVPPAGVSISEPAAEQLASNSIDLVFQRSLHPIGVLESCIISQAQLDAFDLVMNAKSLQQHQVNGLLDVLELLAQDPWFQKAWSMRDLMASWEKMVLLLQYDARLDRKHGKGIIPGELCFGFLDLMVMVERVQRDFCEEWFYINKELGMRVRKVDGVVDFASWSENDGLVISENQKKRIEKAVKILRSMFLMKEAATTKTALYAPEQQVSASQALNLLEDKKATRTEDRIAILGSICKYPIRLDTSKLNLGTSSFSICTLTLSLLNGDLSILANINGKDSNSQDQSSMESNDTLSWLLSPTQSLSLASNISTADRWLIKPPLITPHGLKVSGHVWVVDQQISLYPIQQRFHQAWLDLFPSSSPQLHHSSFSHSTRTPYQDKFIQHFFWELLLHLLSINQLPLCELIWTATHQRIGNPRFDPETLQTYTRTEALPRRFLGVVTPGGKQKAMLPGVSLLNPIPDLLGSHEFSINWMVEQVMLRGCLYAGRQASSRQLQGGDGHNCVLFSSQQKGNFFTPSSASIVNEKKIRSWKVEWTGKEVDDSPVFTTERVVEGMSSWTRFEGRDTEDEVFLV